MPSGGATPPAVEALLRKAVELTDRPKRDTAILMHADFAHNPQTIPDLVRRIESGADIVVAEGQTRGRALPSAALVRRYAPPCCGASSRCPACGTWCPASPAFRLVALRNAIRSQRERLLLTDGWAANAELYWRAGRYARRIETVTSVERHDLRAARRVAAVGHGGELWARPANAARLAGAADAAGARRRGERSRPRRSRHERPSLLTLALLQGGPRARASRAARISLGRRREADLQRQARHALARRRARSRWRASTPCAGSESFRFRFRLQGKTIIYSLDDVLESYVGTAGPHLAALRAGLRRERQADASAVRDLSRFGLLPRDAARTRAAAVAAPTRSTTRPSSISSG